MKQETTESSQDTILALIQKNPGIRPAQLRELAGLPMRTITWNLGQLKRKHLVKARDDLRDLRCQCYYMVESPQAIKDSLRLADSAAVVAGVNWPEAAPDAGNDQIAAGGKA